MIKIRIKNADHEIDVRFPISENELYAKLAEIHAIEEKDAPQSAFVTEVYWPEEFSMLKDRFANLDELNYLAKRMESFDYHEYDQFLIGITKLQNPTEKDLINLTFNLDHFTLCKDVSSYGKIGREYVMNTQGAVPANDEDDPKYAAIGKELIDTRMLKEHNVDVYFEEQGIHSIQPGAEFYITIYGSIAQSESENISANVRWGKAQSAKEGNVPFHYKRFLGYRRGSDGKPEIDPEQAVVVKRIYERFLAGDSLATIANDLNTDGIPTPSGVGKWQRGTIESILTNEKYKGDAILNKTYIRDCLSKKVMINNGERPKYYVENNHPAIIDSATFGRVQEEMARRCGKRKVKQVGTKTEQGRYSSKYALTELLICGECGTPYRRCTWAANGKKKVVWRCINRLDYGKKYCHYSPSIEESVLQEAIMKAVMQTAKQNAEVLKTLKLHIGMGLSAGTTEDNSLDLQIRIAEIEAEFQKMLKAIAADNVEAFDEEKAKALMDEKAKLQIQLDRIADTKQKRENAKSRLDEIFTIIEALANHPISYDDQIVRQILESVIVESKEKIKVVFVGGLEVTQTI